MYTRVSHSRSVYVSTSWKDTWGCCLPIRHMNCHRRERSGVYSLCVCAARDADVPSQWTAAVSWFAAVLLEGSDTLRSSRRLRSRGELEEAVFSVWKAGVTWMNMSHSDPNHIISSETALSQRGISSSGDKADSLQLSYAFLWHSSLISLLFCCLIKTIPLSRFSPFLLHTSLLSAAIPPSHLAASVCLCPLFLSASSLPEELWSTTPTVFQSFYTSPPPLPDMPLSLSPSIPLPVEALQG